MKSRQIHHYRVKGDAGDNEFLFGCSERVVACSEFQRLLTFMREYGFNVDKY